MKAKVVKSKGLALCRLCAWGHKSPHYIDNMVLRRKKIKKITIPKDELCLEIRNTDPGPVSKGYLCKKHAIVFQKQLNDTIGNL